MDTRLDPRGSSVPGCVVTDIIDGRPWNASRIRNNSLRQHCHILAGTFRHSNPILDQVRGPCRRLFGVVAGRGGIFDSIHPRELSVVPSLIRMAWYWRFWHRQPEEWNPDPTIGPWEQWRSLLRHLFGRGHPLPEFFDSAWLANGPLTHVERDWYCHAAVGLSLREARHLPKTVTNRALHLAMQAPVHLTIRQAFRWGQVRAAGGSEALFEAVISSRMALDFCSDDIWLRLIQKVAQVSDFPMEEFGAIVDLLWLDLANDKRRQATRLVSGPLQELRRRAKRFWGTLLHQLQQQGVRFRNPDPSRPGIRRQLAEITGTSWRLMPVSHRLEELELKRWKWQIHQLDSHLQLVAEGIAMKHCVASYRKKCRRGASAIFSFRIATDGTPEAERCFTVEVDPGSRRIVQIRNRWNQWLSEGAVPMVRVWAKANQLRCSYYRW